MPLRRLRLIGRFLPAALLAGSLLIGSAAQALTLKVGIYTQEPDVFIGQDGQPAGILGEILKRIADREGWSLNTVPCDWAQCLNLLRAGRIDILPDVTYTPERAKQFSFHHTAALSSWSQIYTRATTPLRSIEDLQNKSLAVLEGSVQQSYLQRLARELPLAIRFSTVTHLAEGFRQVRDGEIDAVAADYFFGELSVQNYGVIPTPIIFQPTQAFYATPKGSHPQVLATIDHYLALWQARPDSDYYQILSQWRNPPTESIFGQKGPRVIASLGGLLLLVLALALLLRLQVRRKARQLSLSERRLGAMLDSLDAAACIKDLNLRYTFANRKIERLLGVDEGGLIGKHDEEIFKDDAALKTIMDEDRAIIASGKRMVRRSALALSSQEGKRNYLVIKGPMRDAAGRVEAICVVFTDITDQLHAEEMAHWLSRYDPLTKLPNRRTALAKLEELVGTMQSGHAIGGLLLINLDAFKKINDVHGYETGDQVLRGTATRLAQTLRAQDLLARIGTDEFMVLLPNLGTHLNDAAHKAMHVAEKLRLAIGGSPFTVNGHPVLITGRIGLTLIHRHSTSVNELFHEADAASDQARQDGGNCVTFYERQLQSEAEQRLWLEQNLLQALHTPQLTLYLQPQFNAAGRVTGGELLARWKHPQRGNIPPELFIPVAEESGLINLLGEWSLAFACEALRSLQALGEPYPLSLNVSPKRLMDPQFAEHIRTILEQSDVPGNRLILEVTEGILIQDIQAVAKRMHELARMGIRFSIDDFGTGYSNLAYLKRLPLYELKIDKSLIQDLPQDTDNQAIVRLILAMADQLGLRVVAEGVETVAQRDFLVQQQCDALQGYLLARPMPVDRWLAQVARSDSASIDDGGQ